MRRYLKVKIPFDVIKKRCERKPEIIKENPLYFENKILNLKLNNNTSCQQQPCEN